MPISLSKILISFFILWLILKEMPIDEYNRQLLPDIKSTKMGNPAWMICKYAMLWPCCSIFSFKALLLSFKALLFSFKALLYFFRHLCYFSKIVSQSTFLKCFYFLSKCFIIALLFNFFKCKQVLIFYSECKSALIFYSSTYETVSNFLFQNMHQLLL